MIASLMLADVGAARALTLLRRTPRPGVTPGLLYADVLLAAKLSAGLMPRPHPGRIALFAFWSDDAALDRFEADDPLAAAFTGGSRARLEPVRATGAWTGMPAVVAAQRAISDDEPVAVLTYGRLRMGRAAAFLRASARAEADAIADPALVYGTGLTRLPRLVSTFSLWGSAADMRAFAHRGAGHTAALRTESRRAFHHESIFIRFRAYDLSGDLTS